MFDCLKASSSIIDWTDLEQSNIPFLYFIMFDINGFTDFIVIQARRKGRKGNEKGGEWERYESGRWATLINKNMWGFTNIDF